MKSAENGEQTFKSVNAIIKKLSEIEEVHIVYPPVTDIFVKVFCTTHISRKDQR